jgi:hypothetical protein
MRRPHLSAYTVGALLDTFARQPSDHDAPEVRLHVDQ